jgi:hypothetical protein
MKNSAIVGNGMERKRKAMGSIRRLPFIGFHGKFIMDDLSLKIW